MIKTGEKVENFEMRKSQLVVSKIFEQIQLFWPLICLILFFSLFYLVYISFLTADLGRHIVNGREIVTTGLSNVLQSDKIFNTNYYSYTQTDFPFINHHWLFGVIVFFLHETGGFRLLTYFNTTINTLAFIFVLATAISVVKQLSEKNKKNAVIIVTTVGFLFLPLFTRRNEIRPESISLLFFSLYYFLFQNSQILRSKWTFFLLVILQVFWANTHLFFILGPLLSGYFLIQRILTLVFSKDQKTSTIVASDSLLKFWLALTVTLFVVGILNPNGMHGLLTPFTIFNNYAYRVAENQSTFFMVQYGTSVTYYSFIILCSFLTLTLGIISLARINIETGAKKVSQFILIFIFTIIANKINRLTPFFAVVAIPFISQYALTYFQKNWKKYKEKLRNSFNIMLASTVFFLLAIVILKTKIFFPPIEINGSGLPPGIQNAADFFIKNNLRGPIFNNYDIGGYLTYNLFPQEKLFIDNRPEAYSAEFLKNEFLLSLTDEETWQKIEKKYNINIIFFYRHDQIDGAQRFLFNRVSDPEWVPIYVDEYALIIARNSEKNKDIINNFRLPDELFVMNSN